MAGRSFTHFASDTTPPQPPAHPLSYHLKKSESAIFYRVAKRGGEWGGPGEK